jgi:SAM-dependent methyltransferase
MLKAGARAIQTRTHAGDNVTCPVCDGHFSSFATRHAMPNARCPGCGSLIRHRLLWLYLSRQIRVGVRPTRLLHLAPEHGIERRLRELPPVDYTSADIDAQLAAERVDVVNMPYGDQAFDLVLCSHVLEHVPDDRAAIAEIHRVLRPGGTAIIVVPIKVDRTEEFIDPSPNPTHADGYRRVGPHGHVRLIGADYVARLEVGGLDVATVDYAASFPDADRVRFGLVLGQPFFVCTRPAVDIAAQTDGSAETAAPDGGLPMVTAHA